MCKNDFHVLTTARKSKPLTGNNSFYEKRLIISSSIFLIIGMLFYAIGSDYETSPLALAIFLFINGIILLVPDYIRQSNKHAGLMGPFDGFLIGLSGFLSVFPGISRIGSGAGIAIIRGADKSRAVNWLLLLTVPAMAVLIAIDLISLFTIGVPSTTLWLMLGYILAAGAAFLGTYIGILLIRFLSYNTGFSLFSYYSIGAAFFSFILYLVAY